MTATATALSTFCAFANTIPDDDTPTKAEARRDAHQRCARSGVPCACAYHQPKTKEQTMATTATSYQCPECGRRCGSTAGLASHRRSMHGKTDTPIVPPARPRSEGRTPPDAGDGDLDDDLVWEEPPTRGNRGLLAQLTPALDRLRAHPGQWARLRTFESKSGGNTAATKLRKDTNGQGFEFRGGRLRSRAGSGLWGRYVDPDEG